MATQRNKSLNPYQRHLLSSEEGGKDTDQK